MRCNNKDKIITKVNRSHNLYTINIHKNIDDHRWNNKVIVDDETLKRASILCLEKSTISDNLDRSIEISLTLTNDESIKNLNKEYRSKDRATNVLSFPQFERDEIGNIKDITKDLPFIMLGDVIMSIDTIESEAESQGKSFDAHFLHMYVHSVLHLLGFDHIIEKEQDIMEQTEIDILSNFNISNPYIIID